MRAASRGIKVLCLTAALLGLTAASASAARVLTLTPTSADFGSVNVGNNSTPRGFTLKLDCTLGMFAVSCSESFSPAVAAGGDFSALNGCPATMTASEGILSSGPESCFIAATFTPTVAGARSATLTTGTGGPTATLTGNGVAVTQPQVQTAGKCKKGGKKKRSAAAAKKKKGCKKRKKKR